MPNCTSNNNNDHFCIVKRSVGVMQGFASAFLFSISEKDYLLNKKTAEYKVHTVMNWFLEN